MGEMGAERLAPRAEGNEGSATHGSTKHPDRRGRQFRSSNFEFRNGGLRTHLAFRYPRNEMALQGNQWATLELVSGTIFVSTGLGQFVFIISA